MTDTLQAMATESPTIAFGARLQACRESLGLERKDAAAQLRLNENVISMMETDHYSSDLPPTFIRGYLRAYGKLLQIPEFEIKLAIAPIQPPIPEITATQTSKPASQVTSSNYLMQISTAAVVFTLFSLVFVWWYNHSTQTSSTTLATTANEQTTSLPLPAASPPLAVAPLSTAIPTLATKHPAVAPNHTAPKSNTAPTEQHAAAQTSSTDVTDEPDAEELE